MSGATVVSKPGLSTLVRPKFGPGMLLQHEDLESLNTYTRELNRLIASDASLCRKLLLAITRTLVARLRSTGRELVLSRYFLRGH